MYIKIEFLKSRAVKIYVPLKLNFELNSRAVINNSKIEINSKIELSITFYF